MVNFVKKQKIIQSYFVRNTEVCSKLLLWNADIFVFKILLSKNLKVFCKHQSMSNERIAWGKCVWEGGNNAIFPVYQDLEIAAQTWKIVPGKALEFCPDWKGKSLCSVLQAQCGVRVCVHIQRQFGGGRTEAGCTRKGVLRRETRESGQRADRLLKCYYILPTWQYLCS